MQQLFQRLDEEAFVHRMARLGLIRPEPTRAERIAGTTGVDAATVQRILDAAEEG